MNKPPPTRAGSWPSARILFLLTTIWLTAAALAAVPARAQIPNVQAPTVGVQGSAWRELAEPILRMGDVLPFTIWNDPSTLYENGRYRMWLTGGDPRDPKRIVVRVYCAESDDGVSWDIPAAPCFAPQEGTTDFDNLRTETPTVVKVDGVYHMYYTGISEETLKTGGTAIGHARSYDGVNWIRDASNPVVTGQRRNHRSLGYGGVGEPGVVYDPRDKTFYLYYVGMRYANRDPTIGEIGILLATSKDGTNFVHQRTAQGRRALILTRDIPYAISGAWFGYSTPSAYIDAAGVFHLFAAFIVAPAGPSTARHVTLTHAVSTDGVRFKVLEEDILKAGKGDYMDHQVRSPTVVQVDGRQEMWFAAEQRRPYFGAGIGYATRD